MCRSLADALGDVAVVGEEHPDDLADRPGLTSGIADLAAVGLGVDSFSSADVIDAVGLGTAQAEPGATYWTLDPIDGTKGFLRNAHYAIALALIEDGEVVLGVLGCPNMTNDDGSTGVVLVGADGAASQMSSQMSSGDSAPDAATRSVRVDDPPKLADARFCESVESGHSDQDQSARIAQLLGIDNESFRIDSQCKYAAVARGDAVDLSPPADPSRLRREDLGPRRREVRRRVRRGSGHRRARQPTRLRCGRAVVRELRCDRDERTVPLRRRRGGRVGARALTSTHRCDTIRHDDSTRRHDTTTRRNVRNRRHDDGSNRRSDESTRGLDETHTWLLSTDEVDNTDYVELHTDGGHR